jgi:hypothetical protein
MTLVSLIAGIRTTTSIRAQEERPRDIISEDFLKHRPAKPKSIKGPKRPWSTYRLATTPTKQIDTKQSDQSRLQVGITIWRLEPAATGASAGLGSVNGSDQRRLEWIPRRVEADAQFSDGDSIRLSIESPRAGYLYVVNRDWLADGSYGETNLIFPTEGEDNRLEAGKLIDIPGQGQVPFTATPKANQSGELLTFIVTSSPLPLRLSRRALPISQSQLNEWEGKWSAEGDRWEMNGGAGQARTKVEQLAASPNGIRQLTREDPLPQTIYSLVPKNRNALLFNIVLSYAR